MATSEYVVLKDGRKMPRLGMGTWYLGEGLHPRQTEMAALRAGLDAGVRLIDTAEMYGDGAAEELVGDAIQGRRRQDLFIVSKVYPHNAGRHGIYHALNGTLNRLGTDYLDLYLLHWRGQIPLHETVECMEELVESGKIRGWGVSNFDLDDMRELMDVDGGEHCLVNQDLYHLGSRGVEYDLLPWMRKHQIPLMAYCPLAQAGRLRQGLVDSAAVRKVAQAHGVTPMQVLLAFVLRDDNVIAIPRSSSVRHVRENWEARKVKLTAEDMVLLNEEFPAPDHKMPLDME
ncbi:MAG: aldo/keto reductase [Atopobiaceae bacterium]